MARRTKEPKRPKDSPKQEELAEFNQFVTAIQNTANIPAVLDRNITLIENMRSGIEGDKNKHERFKSYMRFQETQGYYTQKQMDKDEAAIEDARRKLKGEYDWPERGADLTKMNRKSLDEYAIHLGMEPDEVSEFKTKGDLIKAIEKAMKK